MNLQDMFDTEDAKKFRRVSEETRAKISAATRAQMTPEARAHLSQINTGKTLSLEHVAKATNSRKGYRHSEETRAKMSLSGGKTKGRALSVEHRALISQGLGKTIMTPRGQFDSIKAAAEAYGWWHDGPIRYRMKKYPNQFYLIEVTE
jgi:hypothetical protein